MSNTFKCPVCQTETAYENAPFPVVSQASGRMKKHWYCCDECKAMEWPDARSPIRPGDMLEGEFLGFEKPRDVLDYPSSYDAIGKLPYYYVEELDESNLPWDLWAVLSVHPDDADMFFVVPYVGAEADGIDKLDEVEHAPFPVQAFYCRSQVDRRKVKESNFLVLLGRGKWLSRGEIDVTARSWRMTETVLKSTQQKMAQLVKV